MFEFNQKMTKLKKEYEKNEHILNIIKDRPGIKYRDLLLLTKLNNRTLSNILLGLESKSDIKVIRINNSNIIRYYLDSFPTDEAVILWYLKINTTKEIIMKLLDQKICTFNEISTHINKAPSTTSWNLKRLLDSEIIIRKKDGLSKFSLNNPSQVENIIKKFSK